MDNKCEDCELLSVLIKKEKNARMKLKLLAILHFKEGQSRYKIASYLKVSRTSVNRWVSDYLSYGLNGLKEKAHTGRPSSLTDDQQAQLTHHIEKNILHSHQKQLKGKSIQEYIAKIFGVNYEISSIYKILERLGH